MFNTIDLTGYYNCNNNNDVDDDDDEDDDKSKSQQQIIKYKKKKKDNNLIIYNSIDIQIYINVYFIILLDFKLKIVLRHYDTMSALNQIPR